MNLPELRQYLDRFMANLATNDRAILDARLQSLASVFPFSEYEYILMFLLQKGVIKFEEYERLRDNYVSSNKYLALYELAPRTFGEIWGQPHVMDLDTRFKKPSVKLDPNFQGEYDLWLEGKKVEVKACRAINTKKRAGLSSKALRFDSSEPFWMNFQQLKFDICDAFVFIGVWVDRIVYWVLSNNEAKSNPKSSHQHRGGVEFQIGITNRNISSFEPFRTEPSEIANKILSISN